MNVTFEDSTRLYTHSARFPHLNWAGSAQAREREHVITATIAGLEVVRAWARTTPDGLELVQVETACDARKRGLAQRLILRLEEHFSPAPISALSTNHQYWEALGWQREPGTTIYRQRHRA